MHAGLQLPSAYGARHFPMPDNISQTATGIGNVAPINLQPTQLTLGHFYDYKGPVQGYVSDEDNTFYYKAYPLKISQTQLNTVQNLRRGDLCYTCFTDVDIQNRNDVYTLYTVSQLNKGAFYKALYTHKAREDPDYNPNKRSRGMSALFESERTYNVFPSDVIDFNENWNWAGVLEQKIPDDSGYVQPAGVASPNFDGIPRLVSMAIRDRVKIPCVVNNYVEVSKRVWEVGAMTNSMLDRIYDANGRTTEALPDVSFFKIFYVCTDNDSCPSFDDYASEVTTYFDLEIPNKNPVTGADFPFSPQTILMKSKVIAIPCFRPLGYIAEVIGPTPSDDDITKALQSESSYADLLKMSSLTVQLNSQGWGPYNFRI